MARVVAALALLSSVQSQGLTCRDRAGSAADCSDTTLYGQVCYVSLDSEDAGCVPAKSMLVVDSSAPGCNDQVCWCMTDMCNSKEWAAEFKRSYVPPPRCWTGVAGSNNGPECSESKLAKEIAYEQPDCWNRALSNQCVENNKDVGMGDGCGDAEQQTREACDSYSKTRGKRDLDDSFDGSDKHCRWIPAMTKEDRATSCQIDDGCTWWPDRGMSINGSMQGECSTSDSSMAKWNNWTAQRGTECEKRMKFGCFENNEWMGEADRCTQHEAQDACLNQITGCSEGVCSGDAMCAQERSEGSCTSKENCSWTPRCCQWIPKPSDMGDACLNSGKGTMDGMCTYSDGNGPPGKEIVQAGFENGLFVSMDKFESRCSLVASFRNGKGSAVTLGSDRPGLVSRICQKSGVWKDVAEHVGHTSDSIDEYCQNFIPERSAMDALSKHKPSAIIEAAKQGQFGAAMNGLKDLLYIVTSKPEYGECLFVADPGKFGAAVCTCDRAGCNDESALEFIVDGDKGPMRLLQFLDGSLSGLVNDTDDAISGILDANGTINPANVGKVTEADVDALMKIAGVAEKTNKEELWGIVQDYQTLMKAEEDYKAKLLMNSAVAALKLDDSSVIQAANRAAGCELYGDDGIPNTLCLQSLPDDVLKSLADATGLTAENFKDGIKSLMGERLPKDPTNTTDPIWVKDPTDPPKEPPSEMACGEMKEAYRVQGCCGFPLKRFEMPSNRRLQTSSFSSGSVKCGDVKATYKKACCPKKGKRQ